MAERDIQNSILLALGNGIRRLFRQNVAVGWMGGPVVKGPRKSVALGPNDVLIRNARPLHAGLCKGSSDIVGWTTVEITREMIGRRLAVFTAVEVKTDRGVSTPEQQRFIAMVQAAGGRAGVARSVEEAEQI